MEDQVTFVDEPISNGEVLMLSGGFPERDHHGKVKIKGGQDQVVFSFRVIEKDGTFSICFTGKMGEAMQTSDTGDIYLHYRFRRPFPVIGLFKHDIVCWYVLPFSDARLVRAIWNQQNHFVNHQPRPKEALYRELEYKGKLYEKIPVVKYVGIEPSMTV
jgi:hypothetical protein